MSTQLTSFDMELNEASINAYRTILNNPGQYNLLGRPIGECFEPSDKVIAKHLLFEQFQSEFPHCPKVIFYILMDEKCPVIKADDGCLGYCLTFKLKNNEQGT